MTLIKSISGIRGTIGGVPGDNLTPIDIVKFATAYVRFLSEKSSGRRLTVVVGRDARISGAMVDDLIEGTLLGCGVDVINVGLCTRPEPKWPSSPTTPTAVSSLPHRIIRANGTL